MRQFNVELFRKRLAHFDDENAPARDAFIQQAIKQCAEAGIRFSDGCAQALGADADLASRLAEAEAELEQRKREMSELIDRYEGRISEDIPNAGLKGFLCRTWSYAQFRMVVLSIFAGLAMMAAPGWVTIALCVAVLWMLLMWATAEQSAEGYGPLIVKFLILGCGVAAAAITHNYFILAGTGLLLSFRLVENVIKWVSELRYVAIALEWIV